MKMIVSVICFVILYQVSLSTFAQEQQKDYALYSAIYSWYGQLDLGVAPNNIASTSLSFDKGEYDLSYRSNTPIEKCNPEGITPKEVATMGAHHVLDIVKVSEDNVSINVEVTLEYYYQVSSILSVAQKEPITAVPARYLVQALTLEKASLNVINSRNIINELDDYPSRFIPSAERNLIRALLYQWTDLLDHPDLPRSQDHIDLLVEANSDFQAAELDTTDPYQYLLLLEALGHSQSRREIKNVRIIQLDSQDGQYQVTFEYQWAVINSFGEPALAQIGVKIRINIVDNKAIIHTYEEQYLPPVTDLGAEIRC